MASCHHVLDEGNYAKVTHCYLPPEVVIAINAAIMHVINKNVQDVH